MSRPKKEKNTPADNVLDYRHRTVKRSNIPPAGLAARGQIVKEKRIKYAYDPHRPPVLRFDATGKADSIKNLIEKAGKEKLAPAELASLQDAFRNHEPWLEWTGKREQQWCVADPVALHIHERISTQAVLRVARRQDIDRDLFADPEHEYREAVQFYKHAMDWTNRMILADSLPGMASLARREALAGKVQMIYFDPPYGIQYASNFQPEVLRRDVKDRDDDLTREPEMVKAYRDTWTLGIHSYLSYLRDRFILCKELLADSGSIFVQISDTNVHRVRSLLDEVFGQANFVSLISYKTTQSSGAEELDTSCDYILWYCRDAENIKYRELHRVLKRGEKGATRYDFVENLDTGETRRLTAEEQVNGVAFPNFRYFTDQGLTSRGDGSENTMGALAFEGEKYRPPVGHWRTTTDNIEARLIPAGRVIKPGTRLRFKKCFDDFGCLSLTNLWDDVGGGIQSRDDPKVFVVQTSTTIIERCMLMTTDPGDLVLDPTCGSGTTAYVAETRGRRWIMMDVSRVALAIARQRLLTAKFDYFKLRPTSAADVQRNPDGPWLTDPVGEIQGSCTFDCKTVPHVTLESIAKNQALDPIFEKWQPVLAEKLTVLNKGLRTATKEVRLKLLAKLEDKRRREGRKTITDADERRWKLPDKEWKKWEVPFDIDPQWPKPLQEALTEYRKAWRQKMEEVNACIAARADQEELVDQPIVKRGKVRVSGPFTMEGVIPAEESIDDEDEVVTRKGGKAQREQTPIGGAPESLETFGEGEGSVETEPRNAEAYLDRMIRLLREDGVRFPDNKVMKFCAMEALADGSTLHAKGAWVNGDQKERQVAVMVGPQYGPLIAPMVEDGIRIAARRGFDDLVFAAFSFDGAAQAAIQDDPDPRLRIHMAQIRPDVNMGDLLKTTVSSQLFTVSGSPRTRVEPVSPQLPKRGKDAASTQYVVHMEGVDIYDPVTNTVRPTRAEKVAGWFLDSDYDGRCFCVCQAFFPDKSAWDKLGKALGGALDEYAFAKLSGTTSLPFPAGEHKRIAVKVIDPRGNEVLRVHKLGSEYA